MSIEGCPIAHLPNKLTVMGSLLAHKSGFQGLPDDLVVTEVLDISETAIERVPETVVAKRVKRSFDCEVPPLWVGERLSVHVSGRYLLAEGDDMWRIEERKGEAYRCSSLDRKLETWIMWKNNEWRYGKEFDELER